MKKFLAILLSVIMLFTLGVVAFAEGDEEPAEMPENWGKEAGKIVVSIDNTYIEAGNTYSIPVRVKADYAANAADNAKEFYLALSGINLSGDATQHAAITAIRVADGFNAIKTDIDEGYLAFSTTDLSILETGDEGVIVGYIDLTVDALLPVEYNKDLGGISAFAYYMFEDDFAGINDNIYGSAGILNEDGSFDAIEYSESDDDLLLIDGASIFHAKKPYTWKDKLTDWAKTQGSLILGFFITILTALKSLIEQA